MISNGIFLKEAVVDKVIDKVERFKDERHAKCLGTLLPLA